MDVVGIIPARFNSTRFEGKVLADINGKPMIQHVWEKAKQSQLLDELIVACDDERVYKTVKDFGGKAIFTAKEHPSGTDRITEIVNPLDVKIVVNIQADEPMIHPSMINGVIEELLADKSLVVATVIKKIERPDEIGDPNVVKVVFDKNNFALYFSRSTIPFLRDAETQGVCYYKHIGLYAYTKDFLFTYKNLNQSTLEKLEKLEQLRILENGYRIKVVETKFETYGVDTPEDLIRVRQNINN
ncbi:MAG: 3-deoxy-manno-octulosonate cytidylyltransferase [Candidatus Omnitrophica bacterium]|nr:3-deoxy-manno-octulosonate cytidylyltransferase [Candidatus Omnitrophota bacterium]MDD5351844.1 3-deoxy-manno-octulosonate cytidylyltransferase [Candidatus Omnitrophota bacterium]MDD5550670.1 3-deoxy-manno-octulosonate cytidylyltransferase [Candidatus Omnitrophota bacterium]